MTSEVTGEDVGVAGRSAAGPVGDVSSRRPSRPAGRPIRIAVDLLGGDEAPAVVVDGALRALAADPRLHLLLVGPRTAADDVERALDPADRGRVSVRVADDAVAMTDSPVRASHPETSLAIAMHAHAAGEADAVVSAGSSGAIVTSAVLALGRLEGVRKPPLAAWVPTEKGRDRLLLDVGGSVECTVSVLVSHAALGVAYARRAGIAEPRVGLLSVGSEPGKGDRVRRAAERALSAASESAAPESAAPESAAPESAAPEGTASESLRRNGNGSLQAIPMRFVGLVEGGDVCLGERADVVVTDGFTGNVLLKGIEGAYRLARGRSGAGAAGDGVSPVRAAALLGVPGRVVVCHGAATADDIAAGVAFAKGLASEPEGEQ